MVKTLKISSKKLKYKRRKVFGIVLIAVLGAALIAGAFIAYNNFAKNQKDIDTQHKSLKKDGVSIETVSDNDVKSHSADQKSPKTLNIPSLGIYSRVLPLGLLAPNNNVQQLDVPKNISDSGWYDCTINPVAANRCAQKKLPNDGNTEFANLIDGHSCEGFSYKCVFNDLSKVKENSEIIIELGSGEKITYKVKRVIAVPLSEVDMAAMMRPITKGGEGLNIITCAGNWTAKDSRGQETLDKRVEVFAIKE